MYTSYCTEGGGGAFFLPSVHALRLDQANTQAMHHLLCRVSGLAAPSASEAVRSQNTGAIRRSPAALAQPSTQSAPLHEEVPGVGVPLEVVPDGVAHVIDVLRRVEAAPEFVHQKEVGVEMTAGVGGRGAAGRRAGDRS